DKTITESHADNAQRDAQRGDRDHVTRFPFVQRGADEHQRLQQQPRKREDQSEDDGYFELDEHRFQHGQSDQMGESRRPHEQEEETVLLPQPHESREQKSGNGPQHPATELFKMLDDRLRDVVGDRKVPPEERHTPALDGQLPEDVGGFRSFSPSRTLLRNSRIAFPIAPPTSANRCGPKISMATIRMTISSGQPTFGNIALTPVRGLTSPRPSLV